MAAMSICELIQIRETAGEGERIIMTIIKCNAGLALGTGCKGNPTTQERRRTA